MKLVFFDDFKLGAVKNNAVVDLSEGVKGIVHTSPQDLLNQVIEGWPSYAGTLQNIVDQSAGVPLSSVRLRSPVPKPGNIVCMAVNYMEDGTRDAPAPINAFLKNSNCVIGNGDTMVLPDVPASIFEGEAELALVISKRATKVSAADADDYIFGYLNFIDGSARDLVDGRGVFFQMKSHDTFAPMGPYLVTKDEIADPMHLQVQLWVNGKQTQNYNTDDMAHNIRRCIEFITGICTLDAGDVLALGTNHRGLHPFQDGDIIEIETEGLGRLTFNVKDDLKRTWTSETRLERQNRGEGGTAPQLTGKYAK
jgi:2-keto-4-pentenoate hydratase/2-oxohepta-3-ene-1,7-dioic acid hydratase in catechol pathway